MSQTKSKKITAETVARIAELWRAGISGAKTAYIIGIGESTVTFYFQALRAVWDGMPVKTRHVSRDAIREYCRQNGLEFFDEREEQPAEPPAEQAPEAPAEPDLVTMIEAAGRKPMKLIVSFASGTIKLDASKAIFVTGADDMAAIAAKNIGFTLINKDLVQIVEIREEAEP